jgi:hypothetical protein
MDRHRTRSLDNSDKDNRDSAAAPKCSSQVDICTKHGQPDDGFIPALIVADPLFFLVRNSGTAAQRKFQAIAKSAQNNDVKNPQQAS